ncbi:MAG TPA: FkbM family methyltransferase [Hanamia sp.]|nr:FkbM family methyltransferase [Hanamia sp.]
MKIIQRSKEAFNKLIFCYSITQNFSSFFALAWYTKLFRFRRNSPKYKTLYNKFFKISLSLFPGKKIFIRTYAGDIDIFYEIFFKKVYELPEIKMDNPLIIDAGANVGFAALYFLNKMPDATIYCIEPDGDNFAFLEKNLQSEIEKGQAMPVLAGLTGQDGYVNLKSSILKYNTGISKEFVSKEKRVIAYSVESFLKKYFIRKADLLKIDIEGSEENIFKDDISWLQNTANVLIEFHSERIKKICLEKFESQKFIYIPHQKRENTEVFFFTKSV